MDELNGTYAKFLHQNAMCAEDIRGEAMRSKMKYDDAIAEIARLNGYIEDKRVENLKVKTADRKRVENVQMQVQDYD